MATTFYVSTSGSDQNDGAQRKPFASIQRAIDAARAGKDRKVTVHVAAGDYTIDRGITLTDADSGLTIQGPQRGRARLLGGHAIDTWRKLDDKAVLDRLEPAARGKVLVADLKALGIGAFGRMHTRGFSRAIVPAYNELFFNGEPMTLSRWPNDDWARITDIPADAAGTDGHGSVQGKLEAGFYFKHDRPKRWRDTDNIWIHGYWMYDWANSYEQLDTLDLDTGLITTKPPHGLYGMRKDQRIYFLNILEELDAPGEWFLDREAGLLYFWPPSDVRKAEVLLSTLDEPVFSLSGASKVTIRDLAIQCTRGHGIVIDGGSDALVAGCTLTDIGNGAVHVTNGEKHGVVGCDIAYTGDGGVHLDGGDRKTLKPGKHYVENCHLHHIGHWSRCYVPAVHMLGVGHRASNNLIHDHPHCAILYWGNEHVIEFNEVHHVALETGDVGAIYTGRDWTAQGNVIRHNYLHDVFGPGNLGSFSVYLDDCAAGNSVIGNVFYRMQVGILLGGGRDTLIENNLFIDCREAALLLDCRGLSAAEVWSNMVNKTMRERLEAVHHHKPPYSTRYPQLKKIDKYLADGKGVPPEDNLIRRNICARGDWTRFGFGAKATQFTFAMNLIDDDPKVVNEAKGNFKLKPNSPANKVDFKAIPFEKIGLKKDAFRKRVK